MRIDADTSDKPGFHYKITNALLTHNSPLSSLYRVNVSRTIAAMCRWRDRLGRCHILRHSAATLAVIAGKTNGCWDQPWLTAFQEISPFWQRKRQNFPDLFCLHGTNHQNDIFMIIPSYTFGIRSSRHETQLPKLLRNIFMRGCSRHTFHFIICIHICQNCLQLLSLSYIKYEKSEDQLNATLESKGCHYKVVVHDSDVKWVSWHLKLPATQLFIQQVV